MLYQLPLQNFKTIAFHFGIVALCLIYVAFGALLFYKIERPLELEFAEELAERTEQRNAELLEEAYQLLNLDRDEFERQFAGKLSKHEEALLEVFDHPIATNFFESLAYNNGSYLGKGITGSTLLVIFRYVDNSCCIPLLDNCYHPCR